MDGTRAPQLLVSNPVESGVPGALAYVAIAPGTLSAGQAVTLTNRRTGVSRTAPVRSGGMDPVGLPAAEGDSITAEIDAVGERVRVAPGWRR